MVYEYLLLAGAGALGQLFRCVLGLKKAVDAGKPISGKRVSLTLVSGALAGVIIGIWLPDPKTAFFTGMASTDLIESLLKIGKGK